MGKVFGKKLLSQTLVAAIVMPFVFSMVQAQSPIGFIRNIGKSVEADPKNEYNLTEMEGPYLIFAAAFSGPNAQQEAHALVLELRKTRKWLAYVYKKEFVFDVNKDFKEAQNPYTGRTAKYKTANGGTEYAVLIGNFPSLDDNQFEKTLADVRKFQPATLKSRGTPTPMLFAFGLPNPMLPPENQRGVVDPFIESINLKRPYTLLRNPRRYTVQIATFTGHTLYQKGAEATDKFSSGNSKKSELEMGEQAAVVLCKALRERGVEAYEFHDRYASIVTVGGFDQHSRQLANGTTVNGLAGSAGHSTISRTSGRKFV